jgi:chromosome segregation ATPase
LQAFSKAPFRLVDEINQGMDAANERMVHELLVRSASQTNAPQYFLITPKLLCDLHYSDAMCVHFVLNGPQLAITAKQVDQKNPFTLDNLIQHKMAA